MQSIFQRLFIVCFLLPAMGYAQITMPTSRIVFQRGNDNRASVPIQGNCPASANSIQVKANAIGGGGSIDWTTIGTTENGAIQSGVFMGNITLQGGWYSIQVRALSGSSEVGNWSVDRVGVGEVFAIAGQSNIIGAVYVRNLSATDDRVSTLNYGGLFDPDIQEGELPKSFINARNNSLIGPGNAQLFWGSLGDKLVARLGVPVMFLGAAYSGTSSANWRDAANGAEQVDTPGGRVTKNAPYRKLGVTLSYYIKRTGIRSVLWHQGESDINTSQGEYFSNITQLINKTRQQTGMNRLSWMLCRVSYYQGRTNQGVINAQNQLADPANNCFPGPATDFMSGNTSWRGDDIHINDNNYPLFESLFNDMLNESYFNNSQPSQPAYTPSITTGYIFPSVRNGGETIQVPYMATAPVRGDNQYVVQLLDENGNFLADLGTGPPAGNNLINVQLPVWADGRVRVRVNSTSPARNGEASEFFTARKTGDRSSGNPTLNRSFDALNLVTATAVNVNLPTNFSDPANLALTYSWQNLPAGLSGSGLNLQGTVSGSARTETATLRATNSAGNSVSTTVTINITNPATAPVTPVAPGPVTGTCGFTEGQFLFTFYGERIYAHLYNGIVFAAYENPSSGFKSQVWMQQAGSVSGFDMSKVSCFATTDPRLGAPAQPTPPAPPTPAPSNPAPPVAGAGSGNGLLGNFFNTRNLSGNAVLQQISPTINYTWNEGNSPFSGVNSTNMSIRWTGQVEAPVSGQYTFSTNNDDGTAVWVNGQLLINDWSGDHAPLVKSGTIDLQAGQKYAIRIEYNQGASGAQAQLLWAYAGQSRQIVPQSRLYADAPSQAWPGQAWPGQNPPVVVVPQPTPAPPVTPAVTACGFRDGQFLFTFYGERIYAHLYNGIVFAAYENPSSGFKSQVWMQQAGSVSGFDMSKVSCFATTDPRLGAPAQTPVQPTPAPTLPPAPPQAGSGSVIDPKGYVDISECGRQYGWARDAAVANKAVDVQVYWDNTLVSTFTADQYRNDLAAAFGGNGKHGFQYNTPGSLQSAGNHQVKLQIAGAASPFHTATVFCASRSRMAADPEARAGSWLVFPNPATDIITLQVPAAYQSATLVLSLISAGGTPVSVIERPASVEQRKIDVSGLQTGGYILRVVANNQTVATLQLLKQ